jgi:hypothetical protein
MNLVLDGFSSKQTLEYNDGQTMEDPHGERISHPQPFLVCSASAAPFAGGTMPMAADGDCGLWSGQSIASLGMSIAFHNQRPRGGQSPLPEIGDKQRLSLITNHRSPITVLRSRRSRRYRRYRHPNVTEMLQKPRCVLFVRKIE